MGGGRPGAYLRDLGVEGRVHPRWGANSLKGRTHTHTNYPTGGTVV